MAATGVYNANAWIDHVLRNTPLTSPATVYLALFDDNATEEDIKDGDFTDEIAVDREVLVFVAPTDGATETDDDVVFDDMPATTVAFGAIVDADTSGNVLYAGPFNTQRTVQSGDGFTVRAGDLTLTKS